MSNDIPQDLYYTKSHEWAKFEEDVVIVGITDHAVEQMNREIIHVDLPEVGRVANKEDSIGVIDSVKAAFDIYAPMSGEIVAINEELVPQPELVANSPYKNGWMLKIKPSQLEEELPSLLSPEQYKQLIEE